MLATVLFAVGAARTAQAQYYQGGGGGRILERDLGIYNSGGLSGRDLTSSFRFARNVSFGRAGGGFGFMGDLGTQDYSEFTGGLGSNDLRGFVNRSQGSTLAGRGVRASDTASYVQSLTTGSRRPNAFRGSFETPATSYGAPDLDVSKAFDFTGLANQSNRRGNRNGLLTDPLREAERSSQRNIGASRGGSGTLGSRVGRSRLSTSDDLGSTQLSASRSSQVDLGGDPMDRISGRYSEQNRSIGVRGVPQATTPTAAGSDSSLKQSERSLNATRQSVRESQKARAPGAAERLNTQVQTRVPGSSAATGRASTDAGSTLSTYDQLKQRLEKLGPAPSGPGGGTESGVDGTDRGRGSEEGTDGSTGGGMSSELSELRNRLSGVRDPKDRLAPTARLEPTRGLVGGTDWLRRRSSTVARLGDLSPADTRPGQLSASSPARSAGDDRAKGVVSGVEPREEDVGRASTLPGVSPETLRAIREVGGRVDSFLPSDADSRDIFTEHMKKGQEELSAGRYFSAQDRFDRALSMRPNELSARVGSLHSQIGGGVFRSAAANLRRIVRLNPEATAVVYDAKLLPDAERLTAIRERLMESSAWSGDQSRDAALLLAYIGFQKGDQTLVAMGLSRFATRSAEAGVETDQRLATFLGGVWIGSGESDRPEGPPTEPASETSGEPK